MKIMFINGSPRKNWNTDILMKKALEGAVSAGAALLLPALLLLLSRLMGLRGVEDLWSSRGWWAEYLLLLGPALLLWAAFGRHWALWLAEGIPVLLLALVSFYKQRINIFRIFHRASSRTVKIYLGEEPGHTCPKFICPPKLRYQFTEDFKIHVSKKCCNELKKKPAARYAREAGRSITIPGMRSSEGGLRSNISCAIFEENKLKKFHPLAPAPDEWMSWYQRER